jgi:quinol-cytochrome oxidoreductase complex cytochrome b subunit|mmetsp:Transcript_75922/g.127600  ORF Transcript_75922/g.127600 Transcript_75922/m.127600 type:complete len:107 (+) Transcript_75922:924-1244(+)
MRCVLLLDSETPCDRLQTGAQARFTPQNITFDLARLIQEASVTKKHVATMIVHIHRRHRHTLIQPASQQEAGNSNQKRPPFVAWYAHMMATHMIVCAFYTSGNIGL